MSDIFNFANAPGIELRNHELKLYEPHRKKNMGKNCLSSKGPLTLKKLPSEIKTVRNYNTFKHKVKEEYLKSLENVRNPNRYA